jgi:organic hydroperoxide reductase OsmC/OhrA
MKISAHVNSSYRKHTIELSSNDKFHSIEIPAKETGWGSKANGGELLFLALATCYCNDIYREASNRNINVTNVEVDVDGEFGSVGEAAKSISFIAKVKAKATEEEIRDLMIHTNNVSEIQNTLRQGIAVPLLETKAIAVN